MKNVLFKIKDNCMHDLEMVCKIYMKIHVQMHLKMVN